MKNNIRLILSLIFVLFCFNTYGQEKVHELYWNAEVDLQRDIVVRYHWGTTIYPKTWTLEQLNNGSYSYKDYKTGSGSNNGFYYKILAKKYIIDEIVVNQDHIIIYKENRIIKPSEVSKKLPDPRWEYEDGKSNRKLDILINENLYTINLDIDCDHFHHYLPRGRNIVDASGKELSDEIYREGLTLKGKTKSGKTRSLINDYYPDILFREQVRIFISLNELEKLTGMTKIDLIIYFIENGILYSKGQNLKIPLIKNEYSNKGFIYCAYKAFNLDKFRELHKKQIAKRLAEKARQDSILKAQKEKELREIEEYKKEKQQILDRVYFESLGKEKKASVERAEKEGIKLIDLGLSVRWADRNLGAKNQLDRGDLYGWGEILPNLKKYKPVKKSQKGAILDEENDPSTINLGKGWHVPTKEQWLELFKECSMGKLPDGSGVVFIGPNGNTITFPYTQYVYWAFYWTNSMLDDSKKKAWGGAIPDKATKTKLEELEIERALPIRAVME